ncbi:MAG: ABC transporter permease [Clostridium sp.]
MRKLLKLVQIEGKIALRGIDLLFFGVIMPVCIALLIGMICGNQPAFEGATHSYIEENLPAIMTVGICATAFMGIPLGIADYRDKKILKHYFVTPVSPTMILATHVIINLITATISSLLVIISMKFFFRYDMVGNVTMFTLSFILVTGSMYGIGMLIASVCRNVKDTNLACTIVYFPMLFLSGATIPFSILPEGLQTVASILPLTQGVKLLKGYALGVPDTNVVVSLLIMIMTIVVTVPLSIKLFKWE